MYVKIFTKESLQNKTHLGTLSFLPPPLLLSWDAYFECWSTELVQLLKSISSKNNPYILE